MTTQDITFRTRMRVTPAAALVHPGPDRIPGTALPPAHGKGL